MEKEFVPYELALKLKQLGFNEPCLAVWIEKDSRDGGGLKLEIWNDVDTEYKVKSSTNAPLFRQAFRWFRDNYGLSGVVVETLLGNERYGGIFIKNENGLRYIESPQLTRASQTYEEVELDCLKKLIEIVEQSKSE